MKYIVLVLVGILVLTGLVYSDIQKGTKTAAVTMSPSPIASPSSKSIQLAAKLVSRPNLKEMLIKDYAPKTGTHQEAVTTLALMLDKDPVTTALVEEKLKQIELQERQPVVVNRPQLNLPPIPKLEPQVIHCDEGVFGGIDCRRRWF